MRNVFLFLLTVSLASSAVRAEIVTSVKYKSQTYYVDVVKLTNSTDIKVEIWFRKLNNATSLDDLKITELKANTRQLSEYLNVVCRGKSIIDAGKTILGCTSLIGSAFCAAGAVASDGALAFVCTTTWDYTVEYGAADCLEGTVDAIATYLGKQREWKLLGTAAQLTDPRLTEAISSAIDFMCEDIKNKKE